MRTGVIELSHACIDLDTRAVVRDDGTTVRLTTREAELMAWLAQRPHADVSREELQQEVWGYAEGARTRTVDSTMARLRRKVEGNSRHPQHLISVTGLGYRFVPPPTSVAPELERGDVRTTLLGRDDDLEQIRNALETARLVTILGMGGQGKTTVARALGADLFVDLSDCTSSDDVGVVVLDSLGVPAVGEPSAAAGRVLASRSSCRVVLDNAEHLVDVLAGILPTWLATGEARFVVTSRVALGVTGEVRYALPPLSEASSVALFEQHTGQPLDDAGRRLVQRLVGHPLAIELAASRARRLSTAAIEDRSDRLLDLLRDEEQSPGHTNVRALLEGSWELLGPELRDAWVKLAVIGAGDLELADAVLGDSVGVLDALHEHALVRQDGGRWSLPELVRSFGLERADTVEHEVLQLIVEHAEEYVRRTDGPDCVLAMNALVALQPALLRAQRRLAGRWVQRAFLAMGPALVAQLSPGSEPTRLALLDPPDDLRSPCLLLAARVEAGTSAESRQSATVEGWLEEAVAAATNPTLAARAQVRLGLVEAHRGQLEASRARMGAAVDVLRGREPVALAEALNLLGRVTEYSGIDPWPVFRQALRVAETVGCRWQEAVAQASLAVLHDDRGRLGEADVAYQDASGILSRMRDQRRFSIVRLRYSGRQIHRGDLEAADANLRDLLQTALADVQSHGHGWAQGQLGYVALNRDDTAKALTLARRAQGIGRRQGDQALEAVSLIIESRIYLRVGDLEDAREVHSEIAELQGLGRHTEADVAMHGALLDALGGHVPEIPPMLMTNVMNRREWLRVAAFVALLSGRTERCAGFLDELEACTVEGHRQLRADMAAARAHMRGEVPVLEQVSWLAHLLGR